MPRQEKIILLSTCAIGFCTGVYLYFTGFVPQYLNPGSGPSAEEYELFTVTGEQYGGCERTRQCAAFQLLADGSFSFVRGNLPPVTGQLARAERIAIAEALTVPELTDASQPVAADDCISYVDGIDYRYEVTLDSTTYRLDTCTTALLEEPDTARALDKLWNYFATPR